MKASADFWDGIAEKYAASPVRDEDAYAYTLERVRAHLRAGDEVLELGCGTGTTALKLADAAARIVATDLSGEMLRIGREKAKAQGVRNVEFRTLDVARDDSGHRFDAVMAFNLLHLVGDLETSLVRIHEQLKPGGVFISKTPCLRDRAVPLKVRAMLMALPVMQWLGKAPAVAFVSIPDLEAAVERAGFEIIETGNYPARPPSRFLVARKT